MKINKHTSLKLTCLSILVLGSSLQAMKPADSNELSQELINTFKEFRNRMNTLEQKYLGLAITVAEFKEKTQESKEKTEQKALQLIAQGANVTIPTDDGKTVLIEAINSGLSRRLLLAIIAAGADVNKQDKDGNSALMLIIPSNYEDLSIDDIRNMEENIQALMAAGANLYLRNANNQTALFLIETAHAEFTSDIENKRAISKMFVDEMLKLTIEQKDALFAFNLSLRKSINFTPPSKDIRRLLVQTLSKSFKQENKALILAELRKALKATNTPHLLPEYKDPEGIQALINYVEQQ